jgi:nitrogen fixation protein NifU and related proteins
MYSEIVMNEFANPQNVGGMKGANGVGEYESVDCSVNAKLYLKIENNVVSDAKFKVFGEVLAIASTSFLTKLVKGKTLDELLTIKNVDIAKALEVKDENVAKCFIFAEQLIKSSLDDYQHNLEVELKKQQQVLNNK